MGRWGYNESMSMRLKKLLKEDWKDITKINWPDPSEWKRRNPKEVKRIQVRIKKIESLFKKGLVKDGQDFLCAATIFQHGSVPEHYALAHLLALRAHELHYKPKKGELDPLWLAAVAKDRWLVSINMPQDFGSQSRRINGKMQKWPINPKFSNIDRGKWHCPPVG
jgi:hypothetical protein